MPDIGKMGKAEAGSLKAISNGMKAKGLTKLRFYCQICQKACRDENGYRSHLDSEAHFRQMDAIAASGGAQKVIDDFSATFQKEFVQLLSRRFGTRRIRANQVYQEHIADRHHTHMNATQWTSLSDFVKHLGREGIVQAEDTDQGWFITWIDNSPAALARQDALQKMERAKMDDEQRQRRLLEEQIARASEAAGSNSAKFKEGGSTEGSQTSDKASEGLLRAGSGPIRIGLSLGSAARKTDSSDAIADRTKGTATASDAATSKSTTGSSTPGGASIEFSARTFQDEIQRAQIHLQASEPTQGLKQLHFNVQQGETAFQHDDGGKDHARRARAEEEKSGSTSRTFEWTANAARCQAQSVLTCVVPAPCCF